MIAYQRIVLALAITVAPGTVVAQPGKYSAAIVLPEIQMRAGGSWQFPPTGKLKKGEQVIVHHEDGGWVAILPPAGSVSWVNHRFLGEFDPNNSGKQNALVMADQVEARIGGEKNGPLAVAQVKLPKGTWVEITGAKVREDNTTWYPIVPPEGDYRWLPKEAVGAPSPLTPPPVFVKSDAAFPTNQQKMQGSLTSNGTKPSTMVQHPQWDKAEQLERTGDYAGAEKLYMQIYQELRTRNADAESLLVCYNRVIKCQDRLRLDANSPRPSFTPPVLAVGAQPSATLQTPSGSSTGVTGVAWPADSRTSANSLKSTGPGNLRRAQFTIDGKQAYALEGTSGRVSYYVTGKGVSLDTFVNRQVELMGDIQVRGDIRGAQYMVVTQVNLR